MIITKEEVERIFASSSHQAEAVEALYRLVFPDYNDILELQGFPEAGERLSRLIWDKFFEFDHAHHPEVMAGGRWMNNGFSTNKELGEWEVDILKVKKAMKEEERVFFRNFYQCPYDGAKWHDEWPCMCNDRCPECDTEIEPYDSEEIISPSTTDQV
jgi:hypothetical protein